MAGAVGPMGRRLDISVVLYHPDPAELAGFLASLAVACRRLKAETGVTARLWLVDNGDDPAAADDVAAMVRSAWSGDERAGALTGWQVLHGHGNAGYGVGHNLALAAAAAAGEDGAFHLIANSDLLLEPGTLVAAVAYLDDHPGVGLVSPLVLDRDGGQSFTCKRAPSVFDLLLRGFAPAAVKRLFSARLARYEMRDMTLDRPRDDIELATGAFMFFRAGVLRDLHGFDPRFFLYFEDFDLSKRAAALARVAYVPAVRVTHFGGHAARKGWRHRRMFIRSMIQYFNKHGWRLA